MIQTKYGFDLTEDILIDYLDRLIGKVWKLLPLWEQGEKDGCFTNFYNNHESLMMEISAGEKMVLYCGIYIELLNKLEGIATLKKQKQVRKQVLECIDIINKLKVKVGEWKVGESD